MGFFNDMLVAFGTAASDEPTHIVAGKQRRAGGGRSADGLKKVAECTPCEMNAYMDSLRPNAGQPKKKARRKR